MTSEKEHIVVDHVTIYVTLHLCNVFVILHMMPCKYVLVRSTL